MIQSQNIALIMGRLAAFSFSEPLGLICNEPRYQETTGFGDENGPATTTIPLFTLYLINYIHEREKIYIHLFFLNKAWS